MGSVMSTKNAEYVSTTGDSHNVLNFMNKILQGTFRPSLQDFVNRGHLNGPIIAEIDPTSVCNFHCPECVDIGMLGKKEIDSDRLLRLLTELQYSGVKGVIFIGGGEPLLHSGMPEPIVHAHELGLAVGLTTNGSLLKPFVEIIAELVSWTRVSVDAATAATYHWLRPSNDAIGLSRIHFEHEKTRQN